MVAISTEKEPPMRRILLMLALALPVALGATACSTPAEPVALDDTAVVIDVRTPGEFDGGHLEGAINIDVQSADFESRISELDPDVTYYVYCRSGNRSGQAIDRMAELGFTDLTNGGSVQSASNATGIPVVTE
jgi:phage shock protein E